MKLRSTLLALAALATVGIGVALCRWGCGENRDLLAIAQGVQRGEELDAHFELRWRHHSARRVLAAEVLAGRMSLREAAGHFRRMDEADPGFPPGIRSASRDECALRADVLDYVWVVLGQQRLFAAAARWYAQAFASDPDLLADPPNRHLYLAARAAALASCGRGRDAAGLDEASRAAFRRQALDWLRAELDARRRLLEKDRPASLPGIAGCRWLGPPEFAGVREPDSMGQLSEAERQVWQELWADVADTLARPGE